jgi:hypothetical protein
MAHQNGIISSHVVITSQRSVPLKALTPTETKKSKWMEAWSNRKNERLAGMNKTKISTMINNEAINYSREKKKESARHSSFNRGEKKTGRRETPDFKQ